MYCMTGPAAPGADGEHAITASEQPAGLRAGLRRLWRTGWAGTDDPATAEPAHAEAAEAGELPPPDTQVPRLLQQAAAWSWRILLTGLVIYLAFRFAVALRLVVLPFIAAILLTALLQPTSAWLQRRGFSRLLATWCVFFIALLVIAGAITLVANRVSADYQTLFNEVQRTTRQIQRSLAGPPFHLNAKRLQAIGSEITTYISQHKSVVAGTVVTGGKYATEFLAAIVLTLFIAFFLIKDGAQIWRWVISPMRREARRRAARAGDAAWRALVNYIRGTTVVAAIHALFLGLALWLLGVPLLVPFIVLVFIAAYIPLIGIIIVGGLAILVALATKGWVAAVILLAVLLVENQIEAHLLQPLVMGRIIKLHPLAIILVLAVGGIIAGIPGAIIAVPVAAVITYAWPALRDGSPEG
jgi:predicted PurR-regulated permease PerM